MLTIRLQRIGKKGQAYFRVITIEHTKKPKGEFLELLGSYDPHKKKFNVDKGRVEYWISKGAQLSPTVNNLMVNYKVWEHPKMTSWKPKKRKAEESQQAETVLTKESSSTPDKKPEQAEAQEQSQEQQGEQPSAA